MLLIASKNLQKMSIRLISSNLRAQWTVVSSRSEITNETEQAFRDLAAATNNKPWVVLSSGMDKKSFYKCLELAYKNGASGYLAGRTIWLDAFKYYPDIQQVENGLNEDSVNYVKELNELTADNAKSLETYFNNGFKINSPEKLSSNFGGFL